MSAKSFVGKDAAAALRQIEAQFGSDAVICNLRRLPAHGLRRLWQRYGAVEITARPSRPALTAPAELGVPTIPANRVPRAETDLPDSIGGASPTALLGGLGLLPSCAQQVLAALPPRGVSATVADELAALRSGLQRFWREPHLPPGFIDAHFFIGPAGSGKTTVLCKWLAQTVLVEGLPARVWRLDGTRANTAESLSVYCQILGVAEERTAQSSSVALPGERHFFDLPGANIRDAGEVACLRKSLHPCHGAQVHLVLNGAYDAAVLVAQARAFAALPYHDVIVTHLDETPQWGRLWNLVCQAGCALSYLSADPEIPGRFHQARPEHLLGQLGFRTPEATIANPPNRV